MQITWLGHACFCLEADGFRVVLDPYADVPGYPELQVQAHRVLCSHGHFDHNNTGAVALLPPAPSPFAVRTMETFHDPCGGAQRGGNLVHILSAGGVTVVHLGDLGHPLSPEQLRAIGGCDVLLVPVGGTYTIDAQAAFDAVRAVAPRVAVPMHYRHGACGLREVEEAAPFLELFPAGQVLRLSGGSFTVSAGEAGPAQVVVPKYPV